MNRQLKEQKAVELAKTVVPEGQDITPVLEVLLEMANWSEQQVIDKSVEQARCSAEAFFSDPKAYEHAQVMAINLKDYLHGNE